MSDVLAQIHDQEDAQYQLLVEQAVRRRPPGYPICERICLLCYEVYLVTDQYPQFEFCPICFEILNEFKKRNA